jgi:hypothetical protein
MISSKVHNPQSSDWSTPSLPPITSQNTQSVSPNIPNNASNVNIPPTNGIQNQSKVQPKTK